MPLSVRISVTVPDEVISGAELQRAIKNALHRDVGPDLRRLFERTVEGWRSPPEFYQHDIVEASRLGVQVYAGGRNKDQYELVNAGAQPHDIFPRNPGGMLVFQRGYTPSTRPRVISSRAFIRYGPTWRRKSVHHPGFEAREFDQTIADEYYDEFCATIADAIDSVR